MYANLLVAIALSAQLGSVEREVREGRGPGEPPAERIANQLREQADRIERLEGEVRRLHGEMERIARRSEERDQPRQSLESGGGGSEQRLRAVQRLLAEGRGNGNVEARVSSLEKILAQLKERAQRQKDVNGEVEEGRRDKERAAARRREAEETRNRATKEIAMQLERFRTKRAEAKRNYEQQRANVTREMQQAIERLEQGFQQADQGMERAIAELEKRLVQLRSDSRQEEHEERPERR